MIKPNKNGSREEQVLYWQERANQETLAQHAAQKREHREFKMSFFGGMGIANGS